MSDKFESITDKELVAEVEERGLENEFDCDCSYETENAYSEGFADGERENKFEASIQILCDSYQYNSKEAFLIDVEKFLVDHGGLIA